MENRGLTQTWRGQHSFGKLYVNQIKSGQFTPQWQNQFEVLENLTNSMTEIELHRVAIPIMNITFLFLYLWSATEKTLGA